MDAAMAHVTTVSFIRWFDDIGIDDIPTVGGKNALLGELRRGLTREGVCVPNGFAVTADAYREFLRRNGLFEVISQALDGLDTANVDDLKARGRRIRQAILAAPIPAEIEAGILAAYDMLGEGASEAIDVAVRSSATAEDLPEVSFAGKQKAFLNVQGPTALIDACRRSFASLFTDRAISYRVDKGIDHLRVGLSIGVQRMLMGIQARRERKTANTEGPAGTGVTSASIVRDAFDAARRPIQDQAHWRRGDVKTHGGAS
jgi:pyruvate,water dikinase